MSTQEVFYLSEDDSEFPHRLRQLTSEVWLVGNRAILDNSLLGVLSSSQCPGSIILKTHDFSKELTNHGVPVISGFHSPMEEEVLINLLRGTQPIVICPARSIHTMRIPSAWREPLAAGRLLILSPFLEHKIRKTTDNAALRNRVVAALADRLLIPHAAPGSKTEAFCREIIGQGIPVYTFESDYNSALIEMGASRNVDEILG